MIPKRLLAIVAVLACLTLTACRESTAPVDDSSDSAVGSTPAESTTAGTDATMGSTRATRKTTAGTSGIATVTKGRATSATSAADPRQAGCAHSYYQQVVSPTCTQEGYTLHICTYCGKTYCDSFRKATGHRYQTETVKPSFLMGGYDLHTCCDCGSSYMDHETPALGDGTVSAGLTFTSNGDGTCQLTGLGTCTDTSIRVPEKSPAGDTVTTVADSAFAKNKNIAEVALPDTVTVIRREAFNSCTSLKRVIMPKSKLSLEERVFIFCTALESVDFTGCTLEKIEDNCFYSCGLTAVVLPESVKMIGRLAFGGCTKLKSVLYGDALTYIDERAFEYCSSLMECRSIHSENNLDTVTTINSGAFYAAGLPSFTGSDTVLLGGVAFEGCRLKTVDLSHVKAGYIGGACFRYCPLEHITMGGITSIGTYAFKGCHKLTDITLPATLQRLDGYVFENVTAAVRFSPGSTITTVGNAFKNYKGTFLNLPDSITKMNDGALEGCTNLRRVRLPFSSTSAKNSILSTDCFGSVFKSVDCWKQDTVIPAPLRQANIHCEPVIGGREFFRTPITSIVLGVGTTTIDYDAFDESLVTDVYYEGTQAQWNAVENYSPDLQKATVWYYSETKPTGSGHYWHYGEDYLTLRW